MLCQCIFIQIWDSVYVNKEFLFAKSHRDENVSQNSPKYNVGQATWARRWKEVGIFQLSYQVGNIL